MAANNYQDCLDFTLKFEGGYVDHPADPGGATNLGITIGTLSKWRGRPVTKAEVRALTKTEAAQIYRKNYWDAVKGDMLPRGVDLSVFDFGVNSGPSRGLAADNAAPKGDVAERIKSINARRLAFVQRLRTWSTFGRGWARRIASCEATALRMALGYTSAAQEALNKAAQEATSKASKAGKQSGAAGAGAGGAGVAAPQTGDEAGLALFLVAVAVALAVIAFVAWKQREAQKERITALADETMRGALRVVEVENVKS
jgi:lysozyme family protein